jgi:thiol:disulfide interchange protein DsbA
LFGNSGHNEIEQRGQKMFKWLVNSLVVTVLSFSALAQAQSADRYVNVNPPQATEPGKVEVLEFFSYGCPHCAVLEPMVTQWKKTLPSDVVFHSVPVAFNAAMKPLQHLYYALEALGRSDLHPAVFNNIHQEKKRIFTQEAIIDWAVSQGLDRAKFAAAMDSFGVKSKAQRADQLAKGYGVQGTPSIAVAGRYLTSPSDAGGYQETINEADKLVKRSR